MKLSDRLSKLEAVANPPVIPPLILYCHLTEAECAKFNARRDPINNPLVFEVRPYPDEVSE